MNPFSEVSLMRERLVVREALTTCQVVFEVIWVKVLRNQLVVKMSIKDSD